eukprot:885487-Rhodomonas_salina.1
MRVCEALASEHAREALPTVIIRVEDHDLLLTESAVQSRSGMVAVTFHVSDLALFYNMKIVLVKVP